MSYQKTDSGYVAAWYLDEDYDGDCFVDCQMFFDFKKAPNLKAALRAEIEPDEFRLQTESQPFPMRQYRRIAVKVVDVFGNESTVVKSLALASGAAGPLLLGVGPLVAVLAGLAVIFSERLDPTPKDRRMAAWGIALGILWTLILARVLTG